MSAEDSIRILLMRGERTGGELDASEWKRIAARLAWVRETCAAWREAQREMDERCDEAVGRIDTEAFERLCDAEQAKVDAIRAQLQAVIDHDRWPRELYFGSL
jgi:hypothetical protein